MTCKCADTSSKRCRWIFSTPDPYRFYLKVEREQERTHVEREMREFFLNTHPDVTPDAIDAALADDAEFEADTLRYERAYEWRWQDTGVFHAWFDGRYDYRDVGA